MRFPGRNPVFLKEAPPSVPGENRSSSVCLPFSAGPSPENNGEIHCSHILHKHSITDFAFRAKLPVKEEHLIEQDKNFWEYLDSLSK